MNTVVPDGNVAIITYAGADDADNPKPLSALSVTIDSYSDAYVAAIEGTNQVMLVQKVSQPEGQTKTVNLSFNGVSQDGTHLPPNVVPFDLSGPPAPPQATQVLISQIVVRDTIGITVPPDPGNATVQLI